MYQYDVAISYESANERYVQEVADYLKSEGYKLFFSPYNKNEMLSEDLRSKLFQVYQRESLIKVLFVTKEYLGSPYTQIEQRRSLSSTTENRRRLIIVNFMGEGLPDELRKYVYLEGKLPTDEIAFLIAGRVRELKDEKMKNQQEDIPCKGSAKSCNYITNNSGLVVGDYANIGNINIG